MSKGNGEQEKPMTPARPAKRVAIVPRGWQEFFDETNVPAAIRHGNTIYVTGHTGEDDDLTFSPDADHQIRQTFQSIAQTLADAGADWSDVVEIVSYHVGLRSQAAALIEVSKEFLAAPAPAWSAVGVTELWDEGSLVEISCVAIVDHAVARE
jgi:enamine deaminase RidA (YjgF/YER057c/UK114 family)